MGRGREFGRHRRKATPCILTPLRRGDLRATWRYIGVFSDSTVLLQAVATLLPAGIGRREVPATKSHRTSFLGTTKGARKIALCAVRGLSQLEAQSVPGCEYLDVLSLARATSPSPAGLLPCVDSTKVRISKKFGRRPAPLNRQIRARFMLISGESNVGALMQWRDFIPFFSDRRGSAESSRRCLALSQHSSMTAFHEHAFTGPVNRTANCVDPGTAARLPTLWLGFLLAENNQRCLEPPLSLASATPFRAPYSLSETPELLQVLPWLCTPSHLAAIASLRPLRFHRPASCGHHPPPHMADRGVNLTVIAHARIQRLGPN